MAKSPTEPIKTAPSSQRAPLPARRGLAALAGAGRLLSPLGHRFAPGLLALLLVLALLAGPGTLGPAARPLQGLLALSLAASAALQPAARRRLGALVAAGPWHGLAVAALTALALGLRVWGYRFGLPYFEHPDEWAIADKALEMARSGNYNPQRFIYPNLYIYMQLGVTILHFLSGVNAGVYKTLNDVDPAALYASMRLLTALLGAGAVLATYATARLLYGRGVGLLAAALLAVFPSHVADSHYITTDTPSSFFTMLAFVGIAALATRPPARRADRLALALICGLGVGLAMGTKYNVALLVLPLLLAVAYGELDRRQTADGRRLTVDDNPDSLPASSLAATLIAPALYALAGVALGFTLSTPYWPAELPRFLNEVASIIDHYKFKGHPGHESSPPWLFYVSLTYADGALTALAAGLGIALAFLRHRRADLLLLLFAVPSFLQLAGLKVTFFRNMMPLLPFVCIFAALGAALVARQIARWLEPGNRQQAVLGNGQQATGNGEANGSAGKLSVGRPLFPSRHPSATGLLALLGAFMVMGPLLTAAQEDLVLARPTTRIQATAWVEQQAPVGSRIWLEDQTLILPAERFRVAGGRPVIEQQLAWYREQGYRLLVASVSGYSTAERAKLDKLAAEAPARQLFDGQGERRGPALLVIDTGLLSPADEPRTPLGAKLAGGALVLEGYRRPDSVAAGAVLPLALFWRAEAPLGRDYTVFVHLLDDKDNKLAQRDLPPLEGKLPTSQWQVGELLRDDQDLPVPANVPPGTYRLSVGMYRPDTFEQLNAAPIILGTVRVLPAR